MVMSHICCLDRTPVCSHTVHLRPQATQQQGKSVLTQKHTVSHHLTMVIHLAEPHLHGGEILGNTTLLLSISTWCHLIGS